MRYKDNKGITITAVVITIIILTILTAIIIKYITDDNGLLETTRKEKDKTESMQEDTEGEISDLYKELQNPPKIGGKISNNSTIDGRSYGSYNPIIPAGYYPVNTATSEWGNGETSPSTDSVNAGLVITDKIEETNGEIYSTGNEWVWVPVTEPQNFYSVYEPTQKKYFEMFISAHQKTDILIKSIGEPIYGDGNKEPEEFELMINSIEQYGGFYIGRYELGKEDSNGENAVIRKNVHGYVDTSSNLSARCTELAKSKNVKTSMIWGCQWVATVSWIDKTAGKDGIHKSSTSNAWGNYGDSIGDAAIENISGTVQVTGYSEYWKANNIYDLAGNINEFTRQKYFCYRDGLFGTTIKYTRNIYRGGSAASTEKSVLDSGNYDDNITKDGARAVLIVLPD